MLNVPKNFKPKNWIIPLLNLFYFNIRFVIVNFKKCLYEIYELYL